MENRILIIEDDVQLTYFMKKVLEDNGYQTDTCHNGLEGLDLFKNNSYSLVLLDLNLPGMEGNYVCQEIRKESNIPVIIFTAQDTTSYKVECFDLGANDYIVKPVEIPELLARVRAHLRSINNEKFISFKNIIINQNSRETFLNEKLIRLSPKEFDILLFLLKNQGKTLSKQLIFENIWQEKFNNSSDKRLVDEHINKLRNKIHIEPNKKLIHTIYGVGYIIK